MFSMHNIISSANSDSLTSSNFNVFGVSCLIAKARSFNTILENRGDSEQPCYAFGLR